MYPTASHTGRKTFVRAFAIAGLAVASGCCDDEPNPDPDVARLDISPPAMSALENADFTVHVRARDADGNLLPDAYAKNVHWSSSSANLVLPSPADGSSILARANAGPQPLPVTATLTASLGGITRQAVVKIFAGGTAISADWIGADHVAGDPPVIALLDGMASGWRNDGTLAFAGSAPLDNFKAHCDGINCGEAVLFSTKFAVTRIPLAWTDGCDVVWVNSSAANTACNLARATPAPATPIKLAVYVAASGSDVLPTATTDLEYARTIFRNARSGLSLASPPPTLAWPTNIIMDLVGPDWKCPMSGPYSVLSQLESIGVPANTFPNDQITLVYVDDLLKPPEYGSGPVGFFAYACPWDNARGAIVFIAWLTRRHTTFPHELGHAVGPWGLPDFGHTRRGHGFDESNVMWPYEADWVLTSRELFTLGQVFQVSLASGSVLNRPTAAGVPGIACQPDAMLEVPCPRLAKDVGN